MIAIGILETDGSASVLPVGEIESLGVELRYLSLGENRAIDTQLVSDAEIRLVIIQQDRRRPFSNNYLQILRRRFPFALLVCVNGRWNEGAARSGKPYAGVIHLRDSEAIYRIRRLISCMNRQSAIMGEYRPLFSPREALWWWSEVGVSQWTGATPSLSIYGHRDSTCGIAKAFERYGWSSSERSLNRLNPVNAKQRSQLLEGKKHTIAIVRNRAEVRCLVMNKTVAVLDLLIADNLTLDERRILMREHGCPVLSKPYQNDDVLQAMSAISQSLSRSVA